MNIKFNIKYKIKKNNVNIRRNTEKIALILKKTIVFFIQLKGQFNTKLQIRFYFKKCK